jgi:hypothetical protein
LQLELRGLVRQLNGKMYVSNCGDDIELVRKYG